ncbi:hypothetical protein AB0H71_31765 [Nocardia sp. NPDC050697]|uniref:hypothetical protein n=1 Tax=Nocardia sp. NPDC050697 TaxID=3155158 RepID=UPI0033D51927
MAKRRLRAPTISSGPRREFFVHLQRLVLDHGDLPTKELGRLSGYSHQAIYKALVGPAMPSWELTERLTRALGEEQAVEQTRPLWKAGVIDERGLAAAPASVAPAAPAPADATALEQPATPTQRAESSRGRPTRLDLARAAKATEQSVFSLFAVEAPPSQTHFGADPRFQARRALADEIWNHFRGAGANPDAFAAKSARTHLSRWMAATAIPDTHQLVLFAYELQLDALERNELLALRSAAANERSWDDEIQRRGTSA